MFPGRSGKLSDIHKSWLSLTHLHFEYCTSDLCSCFQEIMDWVEIFGVISQNWGNSLTDLKLRLPVAKNAEEKAKVTRDSEQAQLFLPNLKRLKIWLSVGSGDGVAKTIFFGFDEGEAGTIDY